DICHQLTLIHTLSFHNLPNRSPASGSNSPNYNIAKPLRLCKGISFRSRAGSAHITEYVSFSDKTESFEMKKAKGGEFSAII
ncbi:MAG: hypothetical protein II868_05985, partial [Butyrivibrio sp.]|nr:hypothetical protein [Butyrivibrio sp.]